MAAYIQLRLFATLMKFSPENKDRYAVNPGTTVRELVEQLGIPFKEAKLVFIDGKRVKPETTLQGGERVGIFPPVGGG